MRVKLNYADEKTLRERFPRTKLFRINGLCLECEPANAVSLISALRKMINDEDNQNPQNAAERHAQDDVIRMRRIVSMISNELSAKGLLESTLGRK